jgi:uncharacterized protein YpbB
VSQLNRLFGQETADLNHISERIQAAFGYFLEPRDDLVFEVLWKLEEVKRIKKVKAFYDELIILEELQSKAVLRLMKAKLLIETVVAGETISKEKLTSDEIKKYISRKREAIQNQFKKLNITLIDDEKDIERYTSKKQSDLKAPKKSTVQETYELWLEKNTVAEIAAIRKLSVQTIDGHLIRLIQARTIAITDVLPKDKLQELAEAFRGYKEESLNNLKEQVGEKFTWDELKMFKASLN